MVVSKVQEFERLLANQLIHNGGAYASSSTSHEGVEAFKTEERHSCGETTQVVWREDEIKDNEADRELYQTS